MFFSASNLKGKAFDGLWCSSMEVRNGNIRAKYQQKETLERVFSCLKTERVRIKYFRADLASYHYIPASRCAHMESLIGQLEDGSWTKIRLGTHEMELAGTIHIEVSWPMIANRKAIKWYLFIIKEEAPNVFLTHKTMTLASQSFPVLSQMKILHLWF
jgi:hypothetical protein